MWWLLNHGAKSIFVTEIIMLRFGFYILKKTNRPQCIVTLIRTQGLVVLEGEVELSLLRNTIPLKALDKIHIFRSRFHSTKAISDGGAFIFEVETPEDKDDLVRLEDAYGREKTAYEGKNFHTPRTKDCLMIPEAKVRPKPFMFQGCEISHLKLMRTDLLDKKKKNCTLLPMVV